MKKIFFANLTENNLIVIIREVSKRQAVATPPSRKEGGLAFPEEKFRKEVRCMRWKVIIIRAIAIAGAILVLTSKVAA